MRHTRLNERFFGTTRGRMLKLLCLAPRSVSELAAHLGLTDNAIRAHLAALERDGLVRQGDLRRGVRRPNYAYELTEEGQQVFPKAYGPVLRQILDVLAEQLRPAAAEKILREAGHRLSRPLMHDLAPLNPERRLARLMEVLGPLAELDRQDGKLALRGCGCPLAAVVTAHPQVCRLAAELLGELLARPVREQCRRGESPRCHFEVEWNGRAPRPAEDAPPRRDNPRGKRS